MIRQYNVSGIFEMHLDAESMRDARETAERILANSGIDGKVIQIEEVCKEEGKS